MKKIFKFLIYSFLATMIIIFVVSMFKTNEVINDEIEVVDDEIDYSGTYVILVDNNAVLKYSTMVELYVLNKDKTCEWQYVDLKDEKIMSLKKGNYTVKDGVMNIIINGNTGPITEEYKLVNDVWTYGLLGRTLKIVNK